VNLDPRRTGVIVPAELKSSPRVVLEYGLNMPIPIPDLDIREDGISATLSFHEKPFKTWVPWTAVFAITDPEQEHGRVWKEDVPADMPRSEEHM
jgi:stringent starvation protein B